MLARFFLWEVGEAKDDIRTEVESAFEVVVDLKHAKAYRGQDGERMVGI